MFLKNVKERRTDKVRKTERQNKRILIRQRDRTTEGQKGRVIKHSQLIKPLQLELKETRKKYFNDLN